MSVKLKVELKSFKSSQISQDRKISPCEVEECITRCYTNTQSFSIKKHSKTAVLTHFKTQNKKYKQYCTCSLSKERIHLSYFYWEFSKTLFSSYFWARFWLVPAEDWSLAVSDLPGTSRFYIKLNYFSKWLLLSKSFHIVLTILTEKTVSYSVIWKRSVVLLTFFLCLHNQLISIHCIVACWRIQLFEKCDSSNRQNMNGCSF